eukprot:Skav204425  [mRNA]  locus=scaffold398:809085:810499:- [translate_table: standard]
MFGVPSSSSTPIGGDAPPSAMLAVPSSSSTRVGLWHPFASTFAAWRGALGELLLARIENEDDGGDDEVVEEQFDAMAMEDLEEIRVPDLAGQRPSYDRGPCICVSKQVGQHMSPSQRRPRAKEQSLDEKWQ